MERAVLDHLLDREGIAAESVYSSERPDFICSIGGQRVGIEITEFHRAAEGEFAIRQIEIAQERYILGLRPFLDGRLQGVLTFQLEEGVPVAKRDMEVIDRLACTLLQSLGELKTGTLSLWRSEEHARKAGGVHSPDLPEFIQGIQFQFHKGVLRLHSGRGITVPTISSADVSRITQKKDKLVSNFEPCDEHWLLIAGGQLPDIRIDPVSGNPELVFGYPSLARQFRTGSKKLELETKFDRVYIIHFPELVERIV